MKYEYRRACKCGSVDYIEVTEREAAFHLKEEEVSRMACSKCGWRKMAFMGIHSPALSKAFILEWAVNEDLYLMEQEEDLLMADEKYVDMISEILDFYSILSHKRDVLIEALCVIVFDTKKAMAMEKDEQSLKLLQLRLDKVRQELVKRRHLVIEASGWIMDYIKEVVFPEIGLEKN